MKSKIEINISVIDDGPVVTADGAEVELYGNRGNA